MPWRLDTATRVDDIVAAIHPLVATGGVAAHRESPVAPRNGRAPSTMPHPVPHRAHHHNGAPRRMSRYRLEHFADRIRDEGLAGMVPETPDDLTDTAVWLETR